MVHTSKLERDKWKIWKKWRPVLCNNARIVNNAIQATQPCWYDRAWDVQEFCLAKEVYVHCGGRSWHYDGCWPRSLETDSRVNRGSFRCLEKLLGRLYDEIAKLQVYEDEIDLPVDDAGHVPKPTSILIHAIRSHPSMQVTQRTEYTACSG